MVLAIDIGNTNIVIGVFKESELLYTWRISTDWDRTRDEYGVLLVSLLASSGIKRDDIDGSIISSVVPSLEQTFKDAIEGYLGSIPFIIGRGVNIDVPVLVDNPWELGSDRIVNAVAAYTIYKGAVIVVDFGTAVTFDYITEKGEYSGGAIAPGIGISLDALSTRTAKLPEVDIFKPGHVIGKNTIESIRAGIFYGFIGLVDGIVERMKEEAGGSPRVIATGGQAHLLAGDSRTIEEVDEYLTLKGLRMIYQRNR